MSRKTTRGSEGRPFPMKLKRVKSQLPPDPEQGNQMRAAMANVAIAAFRAACCVDKEDALGDLLASLMHLCDRDHQLGTFDAGLISAYSHYRWETATDAEYASL